jgi:glycosyltransferase involved in cell wall biosynthesis
MEGGSRVELSIAAPACNEIEALPELRRRLGEVLDPLGSDWELVIADDGSTDGTREWLRSQAEHDPRLRAVLLSRNFGHTPGYLAALEHTSGRYTVVMDSDLQDEPELIPAMLDKASEGFDVVYAIKARRHEGLLMRLAFSLYYRLAGRISTVPQPSHAGPFCLMSRRVVEEIVALPERHMFFPGVRAYVGFPQAGFPVDRPARSDGTSRITLHRRISGALDGIIAFSHAPLRMASWVGLIVAAGAAVLVFVLLYLRLFTDNQTPGLTAILTVLLFLGGVQLLSLGILGEYVGRVYDEVKRRPRYVVEERINLAAPEGEGARSAPGSNEMREPLTSGGR